MPPTFIEDSQASLWSIQPTSSPKKISTISEDAIEPEAVTPKACQAAASTEECLEIPSTSQAVGDEEALEITPRQPRENQASEAGLFSLK
ncbi:hypothetical protein ACHK7U_00645, partial [Staphylococcus hominis]|uniref:hypothetical protein n=1 Tax=Staphylococcus hominis TaxID=1290 RepID=UPI0039BF1D49